MIMIIIIIIAVCCDSCPFDIVQRACVVISDVRASGLEWLDMRTCELNSQLK